MTDQMNRQVVINYSPARVISLVPSITEYLLDIEVPVVGRTRFCVHPEEKVKNIPIIGGTKKFKLDRITELQPDLIIGNKEENYQEGISLLQKDFPVWMSDILTLDDQYEMMYALGKVTGRLEKAERCIEAVQARMDELYNTCSGRVLYLIWKKPWMAVGSGTFIHSFLTHLGYENCISESRYPVLGDEQIRMLDPDVILLSSEPFPFKEEHKRLLDDLCAKAEVMLVNGEMYSWYGSRLLHL